MEVIAIILLLIILSIMILFLFKKPADHRHTAIYWS